MPPDPEPGTLGAFIRAERERQDLSIRQLARLVDADPAAVLRWEQNERTPKAGAINALARALELSTSELMSLSGVDYPHDSPSLPAMLRAEYDLPPEAIEQVERYVARVAKQYGAAKPSSSPKERRNS